MLLADGDARGAIEEAKNGAESSAYAQFILHRSFCDAAEVAREDQRAAIVREGLQYQLPPEFAENGLIQVQRARLAKIAVDPRASSDAIAALQRLGVGGAVIDSLRLH